MRVIEENEHGRLCAMEMDIPGVCWVLEELDGRGNVCGGASTCDGAKAKRMWSKLKAGKRGWRS